VKYDYDYNHILAVCVDALRFISASAKMPPSAGILFALIGLELAGLLYEKRVK